MKVLFIANDDDKFGAPKSLMEMVTTLKNHFDVTPIVLTSKPNQVNVYCNEHDIENYVTYHPNVQVHKGKNIFLFIVKYTIKKIYYEIFKRISLWKVKKYISFDDIDMIHSNTTATDFGATLSSIYHKKHIWHIREFGDKDFSLIPLRKNYISFMNQNTDHFICISKAIQKAWIGKGIYEEKSSVIYNGIQFPYSRIKTHFTNSKKLKIIFTGSISETKGQIHLLKALTYLPIDYLKNIQVDFFGTGKEKYIHFLVHFVQSHKLDSCVNFKGYCSHLEDQYAKYDIGIQCSRSEGFGRVTVEYMLAGLCVIASNTGANVEIISDNKNGFLYDYENDSDLANKIIYLYENREVLKKISLQAIQNVKNNFITEINAKNVYQLYKVVL